MRPRWSLLAVSVPPLLWAGALLAGASRPCRVLACGSSVHHAEPADWEPIARAALSAPDPSRSRCPEPSRVWRLPPQPGLAAGGTVTLVTFDSAATCEADRVDPRALVIGGLEEAHGAIELPVNTMSVELEVVDGGGERLLVVVRCEVWRGGTGEIVATWDPVRRRVDVALDTWAVSPDRSFACRWQPLGGCPTEDAPPPGTRLAIEGVLFEFVPLSGD